MTNTLNLKPCPFCGSISIIVEPETDSQPAYSFCRECVAIGPSAKDSYEAAYQWNSREVSTPIMNHLLNIRQVCQCLGLSRATIYRLVQKGEFPAPLHPRGTKASRWTINDIDHYQQSSIKPREIPQKPELSH